MINLNISAWGPHTTIGKVSDEIVNLLIDKGKEVRKPESNCTKELAGRLKESYAYENYNEWFVPLFHEHIVTYINTLGPGASKDTISNIGDISWELTKLWINYQKPGEHNPPHNHQGDLSFVIYPDIPKEIANETDEMSGNIVFEFCEKVYGNFLSFTNTAATIAPKTGDVIIFPAHLSHHVYSFESDVERVSVSGNIRLKTLK